MNIPPKFKLQGNVTRASELRPLALRFYEQHVRTAELGGISFVSRAINLEDGSRISITSYTDDITSDRFGTITIVGAEGKEEETSGLYFAWLDQTTAAGTTDRFYAPNNTKAYWRATKAVPRFDNKFPTTLKKVPFGGGLKGWETLEVPLTSYGELARFPNHDRITPSWSNNKNVVITLFPTILSNIAEATYYGCTSTAFNDSSTGLPVRYVATPIDVYHSYGNKKNITFINNSTSRLLVLGILYKGFQYILNGSNIPLLYTYSMPEIRIMNSKVVIVYRPILNTNEGKLVVQVHTLIPPENDRVYGRTTYVETIIDPNPNIGTVFKLYSIPIFSNTSKNELHVITKIVDSSNNSYTFKVFRYLFDKNFNITSVETVVNLPLYLYTWASSTDDIGYINTSGSIITIMLYAYSAGSSLTAPDWNYKTLEISGNSCKILDYAIGSHKAITTAISNSEHKYIWYADSKSDILITDIDIYAGSPSLFQRTDLLIYYKGSLIHTIQNISHFKVQPAFGGGSILGAHLPYRSSGISCNHKNVIMFKVKKDSTDSFKTYTYYLSLKKNSFKLLKLVDPLGLIPSPIILTE